MPAGPAAARRRRAGRALLHTQPVDGHERDLHLPRAAGRALTDREQYLRRWSDLHGGYDATSSPVVYRWLLVTYPLARPLAAAGVAPNAVTLAALPLAALAVWPAAAGAHWPLLAVLAVLASGLADSVDGALAVLSDRETRVGYVLDSVVDRVCDLAYLGAVWVLGAPGVLVAAAGAMSFLQEYTRARAVAGGMTDVGVVTVAERPVRVIVTVCTLAAAGALPDRAAELATAGAAVWAALSVVAFGQLLVEMWRRLR